uniref:Enoyl-CoA hydratase domain-containing protein 3, mitochondrial n=1 Tax=Chaetoceros debilis TaxID=122233 RepID=A0A7S3QB05_9STRA
MIVIASIRSIPALHPISFRQFRVASKIIANHSHTGIGDIIPQENYNYSLKVIHRPKTISRSINTNTFTNTNINKNARMLCSEASCVTSPSLLQSLQDGVLTLTLNRPRQRNALDFRLLSQMHCILSHLDPETDKNRILPIGGEGEEKFGLLVDVPFPSDAVRAVVLQASGPVFCSGHDLKELQQLQINTESSSSPPSTSDTKRFASESENENENDRTTELFHLCSEVMMLLRKIPQPTISAVHGMATAAGCQLAASTDITIASKDAQFMTPGVNIGLFCSTPSVPLLECLPKKIAFDMLYTGRILTSNEALMYGLVSRVVDEAPPSCSSKSATDEDAIFGTDTRTDSNVEDEIRNCHSFVSSPGARVVQREANTVARLIASKSAATMKLGKGVLMAQTSSNYSMKERYRMANQAMVENLDTKDARLGIKSFLEKRRGN